MFVSLFSEMLIDPGTVKETRFELPCFLDIFQAGPSSDRSTSICLSFVALPSVICVNTLNQAPSIEAHVNKCFQEILLTSLDLMRYRTILPRSAANV